MAQKQDRESIPQFYQRTHALYSRLGYGSYWLRYRLTALAWSSAIGLVLLTLLSGLGVFLSMIHVIGLIVAMWLVALVGLAFSGGRVQIERELPRTASVGQPLVYRVKVQKLKKRLANFQIVEHPAVYLPTVAEFYYGREPGEELRNSFDRRFAFYRWQWIIQQRKFFRAKESSMLSLHNKDNIELQFEITPLRRGVLELLNAYCITPEPLGLLQRYRKAQQSTDKVIVLPKRYPIPDLHMGGSSRNQFGGEALSRISGQSGEFVSLRDYRPGDSRRMIHWKSWAKVGSPVVKEVEEEFFPRYGLVLDTQVRGEKDHLFEIAVSVAASFSCAIDTRRCLLEVVFFQQGVEVHTLGKNIAEVSSMLELLAGVLRQNEGCFQDLEATVRSQSELLSSCIVVLVHLTEEHAKTLKTWRAAGIDIVVLLIAETKQEARQQLDESPLPFRTIPIGSQSVENDLLALGV